MREAQLLRVVHAGIARTFMVSAGVVRTSAGGARSFVLDAGVGARVVCAAVSLHRCPWFFPPGFVGGSFPSLANQTPPPSPGAPDSHTKGQSGGGGGARGQGANCRGKAPRRAGWTRTCPVERGTNAPTAERRACAEQRVTSQVHKWFMRHTACHSATAACG